MRRAIVAATILIVFVGLARAGTRADLSGDAVVDFATTMDMPFMTGGQLGNLGKGLELPRTVPSGVSSHRRGS